MNATTSSNTFLPFRPPSLSLTTHSPPLPVLKHLTGPIPVIEPQIWTFTRDTLSIIEPIRSSNIVKSIGRVMSPPVAARITELPSVALPVQQLPTSSSTEITVVFVPKDVARLLARERLHRGGDDAPRDVLGGLGRPHGGEGARRLGAVITDRVTGLRSTRTMLRECGLFVDSV
ncbi:hypothetical protein B0H17DRAFT_1210812 [Mycena rosella]|uniref:Uncharacterized protein n=1 Tax=Mycena rosella TaxID=1033263 RepID=A0AAD7G830_MYCRO|nr:hypothetical protein B0H17DRAFT_1210812 [Mycena rosella]